MLFKHKVLSALTTTALVASFSFPLPAHALIEGDELGGKPTTSYTQDIQDKLPQLSANSWAIADDNGNILYSHNGEMPVKIASVTKIMTAIIAADYPLDTPIVVSEYAASIPGSSAYIQEGDTITLSELLEGLILPSGNDAAYAIAEGLGEKMLEKDGIIDANARPSEEKVSRFIDEMNTKASELELKDTFFVNPCGLDDEGFEGEHHSCADDVALMAREVMSKPTLATICDASYAEMDYIRGGEPATTPMKNTNRLLEQRVDEVAGVKTGFTDAAGSCFAGCGIIDGDQYYTATLGCTSSNASFYDSATLWDWVRDSRLDVDYFAGYDKTEDGDYLIGRLAANEWTDKTYRIVVKNDESIPKWYWEDDYNVSCSIDNPTRAIEKGECVGSFNVTDHEGNIVRSVDLIAADSVESPNWWESICIFFSRLFSPLTGSATTAENEYYNGFTQVTGLHYSPQTVPVQF